MSKPRTIRLEDVRTIPDKSVFNNDKQAGVTPDWLQLDLSDPDYAVPPEPPSILGIIYTGRRHVISGPPESVKTLFAYILALTAIRDDVPVALIDFEMGPTAARRLLDDLGATNDELQAIYYVNPETKPERGLERIIHHGCELVIIDASIGAYDASGLDDNARKDVQAFASAWIDPLWKNGVASLMIDHVTKNVDTRGKFTIGSERKLGATDVHLGLEPLKTLTRGGTGLVKLHVHKDRPGFLPRPYAAILDLTSNHDTHQISWVFKDAGNSDPDQPWRPTILMGRISAYLEQQPEPVSSNNVLTNVKGNQNKKQEAIEHLIALEYVTEEHGERGARMLKSERLYVPEEPPLPTSTHLDQIEVPLTSTTSTPPLQGVEVEVEDVDRSKMTSTSTTIDVHDPSVQALLDDNDGIPF